MNRENNPILIMQLGIKFNKLSEEIRKIVCESFKIEYTENKVETNQRFVNRLYFLNDTDIKTIEGIFKEELDEKKNELEYKEMIEKLKIEKKKKRNFLEFQKELIPNKSQEKMENNIYDKDFSLIEEKTKILKKPKNKQIYPRFLKEKEHYYYIDNNKKEWSFTEMNGTKESFYFKCSTHKCQGFGKLKRNIKDEISQNNFILTKEHSIPYEEHTYYKDKIIPKKLESDILTKKDWLDKNIRIKCFRKYFKENMFASSIQCIEYIKGKFGKDIEITEEIKTEINSSKVVVNQNIKNRKNILEQINNLKDNKGNAISIFYDFEGKLINKKKIIFFGLYVVRK